MTAPRFPAAAAPVLTTTRLVMRGHTMADFPASAAMWADPGVTRYIGGRPSTAEESWSRLLRYGGLWALLGFGYWVVEDRHTGAFVGEVGLADFRREVEPGFGEAPEAGWVLSPQAQGRGLATEALRAALRWADDHLAAPRTVCMIAPDNVASLRVAAACGYVVSAPASYKGEPVLLLERG